MADIFISYSRKDSDAVKEIVHILEQDGFSVWIDLDGIESGDAFKRQIVQALDECKLVLFFSSEASNMSQWTEKEINVAIENRLPIIPIRLDMTRYNPAVRFDLSGLDFIDLTNPEKKNGMIGRLRRSIRAKLGKKEEDVPQDATVSNPIPTSDMDSLLRPLTLEEIKKSEGFKRVKAGQDSNLYGFQDSETQRMVIEPQFEDADMRFENGMVRAKKDGKWGCIDMYGQTILSFEYGYLSEVHDRKGTVLAMKNGKYGIIDMRGWTIIPFDYEELSTYAPLMIARQNGYYGVIDSNNQVYFPFRCTSAQGIRVVDEKTILLQKDYNWGMFAEGRFVFPCDYYSIMPFAPGFFILLDKNGYHFGNLSGLTSQPVWPLLGQKWAIQADQVLVGLEKDAIPCIDKGGRFRNLDKCAIVCLDDQLSVHPIEDAIQESSGRCFACAHGLWGEIVLPSLYQGIYLFIDSLQEKNDLYLSKRGPSQSQELYDLFKEKCKSLDSSLKNKEITAMYKECFNDSNGNNPYCGIFQWEAKLRVPCCLIPFKYESITVLKQDNG